jgi:drug/metabolite transporter (DMT)-like permease
MSSLSHSPQSHILAGALFISFSGIWVVWAGEAPLVSAFYRVFFGGLFLTLCCLYRGEFQRISLATAGLASLCGLFFAGDLYCWHVSISLVGPGLATILGNFQVFLMTLFGWLAHGDRPRTRFLAALPLAFAGLLLIVGVEGLSLTGLPDNTMPGIGYGLATALCYTGFLLGLRRLQQAQQGYSFFFTLMLVSFTTSFFLFGQTLLSGPELVISTLPSLGCLLALGLLNQTVGWALITNSLPLLPPALAGLSLLLQPTLSFVWDVLILSRPTSLLNWLGLLITLVAIYLGMAGARGRT